MPTTSATVCPRHICSERGQVDEARAPDVVAIGRRPAVGDHVKAEFSLRVLDPRVGLARGDLDLVALLAGQDRPFGQVAHRLLEDLDALAISWSRT